MTYENLKSIDNSKSIFKEYYFKFFKNQIKRTELDEILESIAPKKNFQYKRILILCCENESRYSVTFGDIIIREPVIRFLSQTFTKAHIRVLLNQEHSRINVLNKIKNVQYSKVKQIDRPPIAGSRPGKSENNQFSVHDFIGYKPDLVVDISSRDGYRLITSIIIKLHSLDICPNFIFANPKTKYFFLNSPKNKYYNYPQLRGKKAHQIFLYMVSKQLRAKLNYSSEIWNPNIEIQAKHEKSINNWLKSVGIARDDKAVLLIDKSMEDSKMFKINIRQRYRNAFFEVAEKLNRQGYKVIMHRFYGSLEKKLKIHNGEPSCVTISRQSTKYLGALMKSKPIKLIFGIDTGTMHLASAVAPRKRIITLFTSRAQDPICWCAPRSEAIFFCKDDICILNKIPASQIKHMSDTKRLRRLPNSFNQYVENII